MIHRKLLIATVIIASVVITACSDMTAPKNDPGVLTAVARPTTVVATINGGGTAGMQPPGLGAGRTPVGVEGTLLADGSATGRSECVYQDGHKLPGHTL